MCCFHVYIFLFLENLFLSLYIEVLILFKSDPVVIVYATYSATSGSLSVFDIRSRNVVTFFLDR